MIVLQPVAPDAGVLRKTQKDSIRFHILNQVVRDRDAGRQQGLVDTAPNPVDAGRNFLLCGEAEVSILRGQPVSPFACICRDTAALCLAAVSGRLTYVKNTPFFSRPRTESRFRAGLGGSDSNENPSCSDDHLIVVCVAKKVPLNRSEVLVIWAVSIAPFHTMSNETFARTGKIGGIPFGGTAVAGSPRPWVSELARS